MYINAHEVLQFINKQIKNNKELIEIYRNCKNEEKRIQQLKEINIIHESYKNFVFANIHHGNCMMVDKGIGDISFKH